MGTQRSEPGLEHKPPANAQRAVPLRRMAAGPQTTSADHAPVHSVLRTPAHPLTPTVQAEMGPRFERARFARNFTGIPTHAPAAPNGPLAIQPSSSPEERQAEQVASQPSQSAAPLDLTVVRLHTGPRADAAARSVGALAFTVGADIVFGEGQYAPETARGQHLLAHELAHVAQNQAQPAPALIQRYESPEHMDLGDQNADDLFDYLQTDEGKQWAKQRGIDPVQVVRDMAADPVRKNKTIRVRADLLLTPGQIIALMGDFYATWKDLQSAPKAEVDKLLAVMAKERKGYDGNADYETITKGRYTQLARVNTKHFAPGNKLAWKDYHQQAMTKAAQASKDKDDSLMEEAYFIDAAGGHFLTDAFASGHLLDSIRLDGAIKLYLKDNPPAMEDNPEMRSITAGMSAAGLTPSLVLKNIHDRMNAEGFEVTNAKGMKWKTFGDNHLKNAAETRRIAAYAVILSRQQITRAKAGETPDPNEVLDLLPDATSVEKATNQAIVYIPQAVRELSALMHRNIGMLSTRVKLPLVPFVLESVVGTISDPARHKALEDYDRRKTLDPTTPYPTAPLIRFDFD
jgi:hypothetical protein